MPPYHTASGNNVTVYLNLINDSDIGVLTAPIDNILARLSSRWGPIANAYNLSLAFAFSSTTVPQTLPTPTGLTVIPNATPPSGIHFFNLTVGRGAGAEPNTRSARISYVTYKEGKGYIYILPQMLPTQVPDIAHEMGHILGLTDRYYEAIYWLQDWAINRTCEQIRKGLYVVGVNDFRDGVSDAGNAFSDSPRLAVRVSLPMAIQMIPQESAFNATTNPNGYAPCNNLMSTDAPTLSSYQVSVILGKDQAGLQLIEDTYRKKNWVAILGAWVRNDPALPQAFLGQLSTEGSCVGGGARHPVKPNERKSWLFPAWESNPQLRPLDEGSGLRFRRTVDTTARAYPCLSAGGPGRDGDGNVEDALRIAVAKGKRRLPGSKSIADNDDPLNPNWMCYVRRLLNDMLSL